MAVIMMAAVLYVVGAADPLDQRPVDAAQSTCASAVALRNGDFESPLIAEGSVAAVPLTGWPGGPALLRHDDDGQHAELTTGTIHQDVTTVPGQTLHWELRHRGGTLTVLAGSPTRPLERQGDDITGDRAAWATYAGVYTVPEGQTTTRFALRATGPTAVDAVAFGTPACLVTTMTVATSKAKVNDRLTYAVTTRNAGGNPARSTALTYLPDAEPKDLGLLRPGESRTFPYEIRVSPTQAGTTLRTRATADYSTSVSGTGGTLTSTSNTVGTTIAPAADLTVDATTRPGPVTTYTITTGNRGPSPADAPQVTIALPDGTTGVAAASPEGTCSLTSTTADCSYPSLPPGETRTMTVTAVPATASPGPITVTASSPTGDLTPSDNVIGFEPPASAASPSAARPVGLTLTTSTPRIPRNGTASFQATVRNDTADATSATIRVHPAEGLAITAGTPDRGSYTDGTWTVPDLAPGATAHLDLTATALTAGRLSLTATTTGAEKKATVTASPDSKSLAITVDRPRSPAPATAGDTVEFRYRLTNDGTEPLDQITVTDTLSGPATCPATTLAPDATMLCTAPPYTVTQDDVDAATPLTNIVTAEAYAPDLLFFGPITADVPIVTAAPSLTVTAQPTTYLLRNNGNQTLSNLRLTTTNTGRTTCAATTLAPGTSTTCTPTDGASSPDRVYAYGTAPGATAATAFGPFPTDTPPQPEPAASPADQAQPPSTADAQTAPEPQGQSTPPSTPQDPTEPTTTNGPQGESPDDSTAGQANPPADTPGEANPQAGTPGEANPQAGTPGQANPQAGTPGQANPQAGTPGQANPQAGTPGQANPQAGTPGQAEPPAIADGQQQTAPPAMADAQQQAEGHALPRARANPQPGSAARQQNAAGLSIPTAPAPLATTAVPARGAAPQLSAPTTPDPSVPNPTPTVITPPPAIVPTRELYWADPIPDPVPFSGSPLATAGVLGLALLAGGLIVLASLRGRWWPRRAGKS
ncbi:DUF7507 domain-containing protein [Actinoplanes sp. CA-054009]